VAVLYRMNAQSRLLEEALLRARLPYTVVGGVGFYERREVKDLLAYLRLIRNPDDEMALRRVLNVPPRGIGDRTLRELEALASAGSGGLWSALGDAVSEARLPPRALQPLRAFRDLVEGLRAEAASLGIRELLERALERSGYAAALAARTPVRARIASRTWPSCSRRRGLRDPRAGAGLAGFLDQVALLSDLDVAKDDAPVVLMTLHSAKGLEFDAVWLVGLEEACCRTRAAWARRGARGGAPPLLRRDDAGAAPTEPELRAQPAAVRPTPACAAEPLPLRDPRECLAAGPRSIAGGTRGEPASLGGGTLTAPADAASAWRPGARVRHPLFGVGTILRAEGRGDDLKLTVAFAGGAKRLVARYAGLEPA